MISSLILGISAKNKTAVIPRAPANPAPSFALLLISVSFSIYQSQAHEYDIEQRKEEQCGKHLHLHTLVRTICAQMLNRNRGH